MAEEIEEIADYGETHFVSGEEIAPIHWRHVDWSNERIKMIDSLKRLDADPGRGYIIWREGKPFLLAGSYLVLAALALDEIAKQVAQEGKKLTANELFVFEKWAEDDWNESTNKLLAELLNRTEEEQKRLDEERSRIEEETYINPFSAEEIFRDALEYAERAHELTETDYSLMLEELSRRHPRTKAHIDRRRERRSFPDE